MASIAFKHIGKTWSDGKQVLQDINLEVADGEFLVLVGPSGCGKSTLLRMLAGLESISAGELWIDDLLANNIPPAQRGLAMVFQSYALYPHMNVFDNMAFSLKMAGKSKAQIKQDVERAAEILQITPLLQRKPGQLSGGQRQRVAIGRAIVRQPKVFLFDEPLSNLDASLRLQMRLELANLHQQLHSTMVYVTHDQVEAMTLGQRIVVLNGGKIEQVGTPQELYEQPANLFVAGFLGTPKMNFLPTLGLNMLLPNLPANAVTLGIRAEHIRLQPQVPAISNDAITLPATVAHVEYLGDAAQVYLRLPEASQLLCARQAANAAGLAAGTEMFITLPLPHLHWFDVTGNNICRVGCM